MISGDGIKLPDKANEHSFNNKMLCMDADQMTNYTQKIILEMKFKSLRVKIISNTAPNCNCFLVEVIAWVKV